MGGIVIASGIAASLSQGAAIAVVNVLQGNNPFTGFGNPIGKYRPATWLNGKTQYSIVVPATSTSTQNPQTGNIVNTSTGSSMYVFDAIWRAQHKLSLNLTEKPVQTGFNISDNAVQKQPTIVLEIGMSDTIDQFTAGMWIGNASKSISAFLTLQNFLQNRVFFTLNTRLQSYQNVMLIDIDVQEDAKTQHGLRAILTFKQMFIATVASQTVSARPQATDATSLATQQAQNVPSAATNNFDLPSPYDSSLTEGTLTSTYPLVANSGSWSSNPTSTIAGTLSAVNQ
jgi:hypothetical protein